jgi:RND family efflux transporter MFP subunit
MNPFVVQAVRIGVTTLAIVVAAILLWRVIVHYQLEPWTRDGRVRADVVQVASDVSGLVDAVLVVENQHVNRGDTLFVIDTKRYELALAQAEESLAREQIANRQARRVDARNHELGNLVAKEQREIGAERVMQTEIAVRQAQTALDVARLNLTRTQVRAAVSGIVVNVTLRPGDYAAAGQPRMALIDLSTLHVDGYFEETKLPYIHVGARASVRLMGQSQLIIGHVESIGGGIEDRERNASSTLLPNINPTFNWVRLAQRVPVRIRLDEIPRDVRPVVGRTATVSVAPADYVPRAAGRPAP